MKFILSNIPLSCFPSDNKLDAMTRRERIAVKKKIQSDADLLAREWCLRNGVYLRGLTKVTPLFSVPVQTVLTVFLEKGKTLDVHNLSIKHFLDSLVSLGIIADDSFKHVVKSVAVFGGLSTARSFADFEISEHKINAPVCERCRREMSPQHFEEKITWWTCDSCADDADRFFIN